MNDIQHRDHQGELLPVPIKSESQQIMELIRDMAGDPKADVAKFTALLDLSERIETRQADREADAAFARVCSKMPRITKHGKIDFGKSSKPIPYAKWEDIDEAIRPVYQAEGFTLTHDTEPSAQAGWTTYHAILIHINGNRRKSSISLPLDTSGGKQNIQGAGSSSSYGARYATRNLFNIVFEGEDDDGKLAATRFIDPEKVKQITELLAETKSDVPAFLQHFEIASVDNITMKDYPMVLNTLMSKKAKMK